MKIKLKDAYGGYAAGTVLDLADEGIGKAYVTAGKAEEVIEAPSVVGPLTESERIQLFAKTVAKGLADSGALTQAAIERPKVVKWMTGLSNYAAPAEEKSFGEWLQALGWSVNSVETNFREKGCQILGNKYKSKSNPNFGREYDEASKGLVIGTTPGIGNETVTKASAQSETVGALGGFSVPVEYSQQLFELVGDRSFLLPRVMKYPMTGLQMNIPALDYSFGGNGLDPYIAGMIAQWSAEGQPFIQTNANLRQVELKANLLAGYTIASRQLLADNKVGLEKVLTNLFAKTIAYYVEYGILNGTGANQPQGILNCACSILTTRTGDSTAGTTLYDLGNMYGALLPEAEGRAFWVVAPSFKKILITMNDKSGRIVYIPNYPNMNDGPAVRPMPLTLFGLPVFVSQLAASAGTKGDVFLVDPEGYAFGLRQEIEIGVSEHVNWLSNQLTYRFLFRGDGQPLLNTYLTLQNGDEVSPFVLRNT